MINLRRPHIIIFITILAFYYWYVLEYSTIKHKYQFKDQRLNDYLYRGIGIKQDKWTRGGGIGQLWSLGSLGIGDKNIKLKYASNSYVKNTFPKKDRSQIGVENATLVMLTRNEELDFALESIRSLEDRFNRHFRYPWVFMNDVPFTQEFIEETTLMASGETYYELIPPEDWQRPSHIDEKRFEKCLAKADKDGVIYGNSKSYRNMCHFYSGFFYKQKRLLNYEWYFRVEPNVDYLCDFQYDPFTLLRTNNKIYGFIITILEYENTIPSLWPTVEKFIQENPDLVHPNNSLDFILSNETSLTENYKLVETKSQYNLCHFWSNFEIGNLNFFRSEAYERYFQYLDQSGGFYYERWGDAPVHSIALNLLADRNSIHHFEDLGYLHLPYMSCPLARDVVTAKRCICSSPKKFILVDLQPYSCLSRWWRYGAGKTFVDEVEPFYNH